MVSVPATVSVLVVVVVVLGVLVSVVNVVDVVVVGHGLVAALGSVLVLGDGVLGVNFCCTHCCSPLLGALVTAR
ncbi:protein of unknown function [Agreia sp. COWG]|nr:protein of unknown function [Agreia sp. COWG]